MFSRTLLVCFMGLWPIFCLTAVSQSFSLAVSNENDQVGLSWSATLADVVLEQSSLANGMPSWSAIPFTLYQTNAGRVSFRASTLERSSAFRLRRLGPTVPGLTTSWTLDETTDPFVSSPAWAGPVLTMNTTWAEGRFGKGSLYFNGQPQNSGGSRAWITNSNHQVLPPAGQPFSVSLWFSPGTSAPDHFPLFGTSADSSNSWNVVLNTPGLGTNELILTSKVNGTSLSVTGRSLLLPGQWYRLTLTSEGHSAKLYLDSTLLAQGPLNLLNSTAPIYIGAVPGFSGTLHGRVDEIQTYSNALALEQISLYGEWRFDENVGGVAADSSLQGRLVTVTGTNAWAPGKSGSSVDLARASVIVPNEDYRVLPVSGGSFSVSAWVQPRALPIGQSGIFSLVEGTQAGWQLTANIESTGQAWLEFTSTASGGTLNLRAPVSFTNGVWTKIDLTHNGAIAGLFVNGVRAASVGGAIRGTAAPLVVGAVPGAANFNGLIDDLKIYGHERSDSEIGPVALPIWEMALVNSSTNLVLKGAGPPGKQLAYSILSTPGPARGTIDFSEGSPVITYHAGPEKGPDRFVYTVSDGEFTSPPATGAVSVVQPRWVSPAGGTEQPLDGSSPARALALGASNNLDQVWQTYNYYDCFFYAPGEYQTTGSRFLQRSTANPGCKHIGSGTEGSNATRIRLVNAWSAWEEGVIFSPLHPSFYVDDFEAHNLVLDCNAQGNPKYTLGEPVTLRIPLSATGWVEKVRLHWSDISIPGNASWRLGPPAEFEVCVRTPGPQGYLTNCIAIPGGARTNEVSIRALADELMIRLTRRNGDADFYALQELEIDGTPASLPAAVRLDGTQSSLDAQYPILFAVDQDAGTAWASGPEEQVRITLPLERGATVSLVELDWNCRTLPDLRRLGPAAGLVISARDPVNGQIRDVPFTSTARSAEGRQTVTFTTPQLADQLTILLTAREAGVGFYSLKEVKLRNGSTAVPMRLPRASSTFHVGSYSVLRAFDGGSQQLGWVSGTQGAVSAVDLRGSNLKFTRLKVIGFGTKALRECFPLAIFTSAPSPNNPPVRNVLVEDCLFTHPATNNSDGLSAVSIAGGGARSIINAVIRRCTVTGVGPYFAYSHAFGGVAVENCFAEGVQVGVYFEPTTSAGLGYDSIGPVVIRSNSFVNVVRGITVDFHPGAHFESLTCIGNEIVLSGAQSRGYGIGACDTCVAGVPGTITNLVALNNIIRYPGWSPRAAAPELGMLYGDIQHAIYANNIVALGNGNALRVRHYPAGEIPAKTTPENCDRPGLVQPGPSIIPPSLDTPLPGYRQAWYNNRDLSGWLLPVRHLLWGVDQPAYQQQWPE